MNSPYSSPYDDTQAPDPVRARVRQKLPSVGPVAPGGPDAGVPTPATPQWQTNAAEAPSADNQPAPAPAPMPKPGQNVPTAPVQPASMNNTVQGFGSLPWQQTPAGQNLFNQMKTAFPWMSDAEIGQHLNTPNMPDANYFGAITSNIANQRRAQQAQTATATTETSSAGANSKPLNSQDFWTAVQGLPVSRGNLNPVVDKLKEMGYGDARVTGEDTIFVGGQEWDIVPAGDGQWQLIPDAGGQGGGGSASGVSPFTQQIRDLIMGRLGKLQEFNPDTNPAIKAQMAAQERVLERVRQQRRAAAAERMAQEGLNSGGAGSGAFDEDINAGYQDKAEGLSNVYANVLGQEVSAQRQELMDLLQMAMASGDAESARAIQEKLSILGMLNQRDIVGAQMNQGTVNAGLNG